VTFQLSAQAKWWATQQKQYRAMFWLFWVSSMIDYYKWQNTLDFAYKFNIVKWCVFEWILVAVRTTIRRTLFFTMFVQHIALAAAADKNCLQCSVNFASLFTQNRVSTQFSQTMGSRPQSPSRRVYLPWTPLHGPYPYHGTCICHRWLWSCILK